MSIRFASTCILNLLGMFLCYSWLQDVITSHWKTWFPIAFEGKAIFSLKSFLLSAMNLSGQTRGTDFFFAVDQLDTRENQIFSRQSIGIRGLLKRTFPELSLQFGAKTRLSYSWKPKQDNVEVQVPNIHHSSTLKCQQIEKIRTLSQRVRKLADGFSPWENSTPSEPMSR